MNCKYPDCPDPQRAKGYCNGHYKRYLRYGSPDFHPLAGLQMRAGDWAGILSMEPLTGSALDYLVGSTGLWRQHCGRFKRSLKKRVAHVRKMTLPQQNMYYRGIAFVKAGQ